MKVKCLLKDASEQPIQVADLKPMPKQNPPMRPNPEPMMTKRSTKQKAPMAIVISDAESGDGMMPPQNMTLPDEGVQMIGISDPGWKSS